MFGFRRKRRGEACALASGGLVCTCGAGLPETSASSQDSERNDHDGV